jgi:hypothetical protein
MIIELLFAFTTAHATPPLSASELAKYQECATDDDCVYAQNGSCDCNNGGTGVAINKSKVDEFEKLFEKTECGTIKGASCTIGIPKCEQNKCLYYARIIPHYKKKKDVSK